MNLIIIYGPIAAGKSNVAHELAGITGYGVLENHDVFHALTPLFPFQDPKLNPIRARLARKFRLDIYDEAAQAGVNVIATMIIRNADAFAFMREAKEIVERSGGKLILVQLLPTEEALYKRVQDPSRGDNTTQVASKKRLAEEFAGMPMRYEKFPDFDHLTVDNTDISAHQAAEKIAQHYQLKAHKPA